MALATAMFTYDEGPTQQAFRPEEVVRKAFRKQPVLQRKLSVILPGCLVLSRH